MKTKHSTLYTRRGDKGQARLSKNLILEKDDPLIETIGTIDELMSCLGVVMSCNNVPLQITEIIINIQKKLFDLNCELSGTRNKQITFADCDALEKIIDELDAQLPSLKKFILPQGNQATAFCHLARTICRRTERKMVTLNKSKTLEPACLAYLNRLSDLLFVIARTLAEYAV